MGRVEIRRRPLTIAKITAACPASFEAINVGCVVAVVVREDEQAIPGDAEVLDKRSSVQPMVRVDNFVRGIQDGAVAHLHGLCAGWV